MLQWICREAGNLGFGVVIERSDNGLDRRHTFLTMICERSGTYQPRIRKLKWDDTGSRKCECPFKLLGYPMADETWKFNVIFGIDNHGLTDKLADHPIICWLVPEEKELVSNMTLNMVVLKNIVTSLKRKKPPNVSNIKQIYNMRARNNKVVRGPRSEMQQLLNLLEDNAYVKFM